MVFSRGLTLTDLNDFITPSQACIKPVEQAKTPRVENAAATQIGIDSAGVYYEEDSGENGRRKLQQAQISLSDCLACSGCITSAESVLISMQSHEEVLRAVESNPPPSHPDHKTLVMSIAPQSLASLAASLDPPATTRQMLRRVEAFASRTLSFSHVYDTTFSRHLTLLEHTREFLERRTASSGDKPGEGQLPMIASACPGWVCYVEKAHSEMIPFLSRTKSPQQVMGTLVKEWLAKKWGKSADSIYHVTVMPCYDKKLEASRQDFYNDILSTRDVDCVLTTAELEILIRDKGWDISAPVPGENEPKASCEPNVDDAILPELVQHPGSSSGSYLQSLIDAIALTARSPSVLTKTIRTADYEEYTLVDGDKVLFRGAKCYGFRNLQNIVRKVGRDAGIAVGRGAAGRLPARGRRATASKEEPKSYDYVEVMACPGGCVNGGGQLRGGIRGDAESTATRDARWGDKQLVKDVEAVYWQGAWAPPGSSPRNFTLDTLAARILRDLCQPGISGRWGDEMDSQAESSRRALFRTSFRAVESEVVGLAVQW